MISHKLCTNLAERTYVRNESISALVEDIYGVLNLGRLVSFPFVHPEVSPQTGELNI